MKPCPATDIAILATLTVLTLAMPVPHVLSRLLLHTLTTVVLITTSTSIHMSSSQDPTQWRWPSPTQSITRAFLAPADHYSAGHRGVDAAASSDGTILAPAAGVVAFVGRVVDREILTISHGDGIVTSFEPVRSTVAVGTTVQAGAFVGVVTRGGHAREGEFHFGVRKDGEYINPLLLFGEISRAVLLPCCSAP